MTLSAASYFGSKNGTIARWIVDRLPAHDRYVEPFGGLGSVLLNKKRCKEEIICDLNVPAVNFLQVLQAYPSALSREVSWVSESVSPKDLVAQIPDTQGWAINDAARFFLYCQHSWSGGGTRWSSGLSGVANVDTSHFLRAHDRLQNVSIRHADAFEMIDQLPKDPTIAIYADPPYLPSVRKSKDDRRSADSLPRKQYLHELTEQQHIDLAEKLQGRSAIVSGYRSELYDEIYKGWHVASKKHAGDREYLWISPIAMSRMPQLSLFEATSC